MAKDYRPVALTLIIVKCLERLVMAHIKSTLPATLDPTSLHTEVTDPPRMLSLLLSTQPSPTWTPKTHVRMLLIDFSSAFNTIIPQQLIGKLDQLLSTSLCN